MLSRGTTRKNRFSSTHTYTNIQGRKSYVVRTFWDAIMGDREEVYTPQQLKLRRKNRKAYAKLNRTPSILRP